MAPTAALQRRLDLGNLTPAQLAQLDLNNKTSLAPVLNAVSVVSMFLISSVVCLRLFVRRYYVNRFFLDDYLIILASIFTIVVSSVVIAATQHGLGKHIWNLDLSNIMEELRICIQLMFVANIFYAAAICFTKLSIIASYMHIFAPRGTLRWSLYVTAGITIGLGLGSIPATIFECIPVEAAWSLTASDARCYVFVNFLYATTAINVTTDLVLCIAPIPLFWRLQLPRRQKLMISVLFFLGGLACIASIIRLAYLHLLEDPIDVTYDLIFSVIWTIAECTIGIVCVSLPPLRSLLARLMPSVFRAGSATNAGRIGVPGGGGYMAPYPPKSASSSSMPWHGRNGGSDSTGRMGKLGGTGGRSFRSHNLSTSSAKMQYGGGGKTPTTQKSLDIVVLSSLTSRHSLHSLHSLSRIDSDDGGDDGRVGRDGRDGRDGGDDRDGGLDGAPATKEEAYRLASRLAMHRAGGVSVTITAGEPLGEEEEKALAGHSRTMAGGSGGNGGSEWAVTTTTTTTSRSNRVSRVGTVNAVNAVNAVAAAGHAATGAGHQDVLAAAAAIAAANQPQSPQSPQTPQPSSKALHMAALMRMPSLASGSRNALKKSTSADSSCASNSGHSSNSSSPREKRRSDSDLEMGHARPGSSEASLTNSEAPLDGSFDRRNVI